MDGIQRTLTGGACNTPIPALANQTNFITEKNSLPIVKVLYGPLVHEAQSAKIIIGPLICEPKPLDDWSKFNLETNVKNLAQKMEISINDTKSSLNEEIEKLKKIHQKPICPIGEGYKIIFDVCYYFEKTNKKFTDALSNCKGKLYEPTDVTTFKEVQREAKSIFGNDKYVWTGFTKIDNAGNLKRSSNGLKLLSEKTCKILGAPCYLKEGIDQSSILIKTTINKWEDVPPTSSYTYKSICVIG